VLGRFFDTLFVEWDGGGKKQQISPVEAGEKTQRR
jgi:hypothetical protein